MADTTDRSRRAVLGTGVGIIVAVAGCTGDEGSGDGGGTTADGSTATVSMTGGQFDPRNLTVERGTTVTWVNDDNYSHTVTSASTNWSKDTEVEGGDETTHTFDSDGVYDVYCEFHGSADPLSGMSMRIGVGEATIEEPLGTTTANGGGDGGVYGKTRRTPRPSGRG